jgi:hypothetical protein
MHGKLFCCCIDSDELIEPDILSDLHTSTNDEVVMNNLIWEAAPYSAGYICSKGITFFQNHWESDLLPSLSYLHCGAPKIWYATPAIYRTAYADMIVDINKKTGYVDPCPWKRIVISPSMLDDYHIPYTRLVQRQGDVVISAFGATHGGYNAGPNVAEAVNFCPWSIYSENIEIIREFNVYTNTEQNYADVLEKHHSHIHDTTTSDYI